MSKSEKIRCLVQRKFAHLEHLDEVPPGCQAEVDAFRHSLGRLSENELDEHILADEAAAVLEWRQLYDAVRVEHRATLERQAFFNRPAARADLSVWSSIPKWQIDDLSALLLDREPTVVTRERLLPLIDESPFARGFETVRAFLDRSGLVFPIRPLTFLMWAEASNFPVPSRLADAIRHGSQRAAAFAKAADDSQHDPVVSIVGTQREAATTAILLLWPDGHPGLKQVRMKDKVDLELKTKGVVASDKTFGRALQDARKIWGERGRPVAKRDRKLTKPDRSCP